MDKRDGRIERDELILISRQFSGMLDAGIDILRILEVLREQFSNPLTKGILTSVERDMRLGRMLSTGLGRYPEVFSPFYLSIVRQGELQGDLAQAFNKVAEHLSRPLGSPESYGEQPPSAHMVTALVDRITPIAFWIALSTATTVVAIAALWYATNSGFFAAQSLGPNVCLLVGILILVSSLVFARLRPRQWVACSFCGRSQQVVAYMRRSAHGAICDACLESSYLAWQLQRPKEEPKEAAVPSPADQPTKEVQAKPTFTPHVIEEEEEEIIGDEFQVVKEQEPY